jgi:hypothetical protein
MYKNINYLRIIIVSYVAIIASACQYVVFNSQRLVVNASSMIHVFSELTPCCVVTHKLSVAQRHDELTTLLLPRRLLSYRVLLCPGLLRSVLGHEPSSDEIRLVHTVNAGLKSRSGAARLLRLWARIPTGAWMFVCCEWCVLSGRGLCIGLITRPEESCWLWCV